MAAYNPIKQITDDPAYFAKRSGLYAAAKNIIPILEPQTLNLFGAGLSAFGKGIPVIVSIGLTSAVSAGLTQMDYVHKRNQMTDFYREELAVKLKKPAKDITSADLDAMAKTNFIMRDELHHSAKERNFGIILSIAASIGTFFLVHALDPVLPGMTAGLEGWAQTAVMWGAKGLAAVVSYLAIKTPMHWVAEKMFGMTRETPHDKIVELAKERQAGKEISQEQVLGIFVTVNQQLAEHIQAEYGNYYDTLSLTQKQHAVADLKKTIPLEQLTRDINDGRVNVGELAFAVEGEISGVEHARGAVPRKEGLLSRAFSKLAGVFKHKSSDQEITPLPIESLPANMIAYEEERAIPGGFVKRLGLSRVDAGQGFVNRLETEASASVSIARP